VSREACCLSITCEVQAVELCEHEARIVMTVSTRNVYNYIGGFYNFARLNDIVDI
jgi:hypothetical protein